MMNLYQMCNEAYVNRQLWDYYRGVETNPLVDLDSAEKFIREMFGQGLKENIFNIEWEVADDLKMERASHMIHVYFLGIFLQSQIDGDIQIRSDYGGWYPFGYTWYLCCLYHDFGYLFENKLRKNKNIINELQVLQVNGICNERLHYYKKLGLHVNLATPNFPFTTHCYCAEKFSVNRSAPILNMQRDKDYKADEFNKSQCDERCKGNIIYNNGTVVRENHYKNKDKNAYFKYKLFERSKVFLDIDHGIIGGDLLFSQLVKNYRQQYRCMKQGHGIKFYDFRVQAEGKTRHFSCEQFKIFAHIADCISCHNIFKADAETEEVYRQYGLDNFIGDRYKIINYDKNPLLYMLCLADVIEPTKKFPTEATQIVLRGIDVNYNHSGKLLSVKVDEELWVRYYGQTANYVDSVCSLMEYMDLRVIVD